MKETKLKGMLLGAIVGDAIGTPLDGLSKAHIHAVFKHIDNYTDASPALKNKLQEWKKSGLYSSAAQLMLLLLIFLMKNNKNNRNNSYAFCDFIRKMPETAENAFWIFRHPDSMTRLFLKSAKDEIASQLNKEKKYFVPSARNSVILIPFASLNGTIDDNLVNDIFSFSLILNKDANSTAGALLFVLLLTRIINNNISDAAKLVEIATDLSKLLIDKIAILNNKISEPGIVLGQIEASLKDYLFIFMQVKNAKDISDAEKIIVSNINTKLKTSVTRATIDHPLAIIPFAIFFTICYLEQPTEMLFRAAEYGGAASILCALTGALTGSLLGTDWLQGNLLEDLVNKKRIINIIESAINSKITDVLINDFLQCEASLTAKEIQEKNAKLKHVKIKPKKTQKKSRKDIERELSAHVVESWTKLDKAKWRKKIDRDREY